MIFKIICTGLFDYFFDYDFGKLPYRSLKFEWENIDAEFYLKAASYNFVEKENNFTRKTEYKYLSSQKCKTTTVSTDYPTFKSDPYYSIPTISNNAVYNLYKKKAKKVKSVKFLGRLAEYQYYNIDGGGWKSFESFN